MAAITSAVVSIVLTVASAVYQAKEARKAKKKAAEAADARKGFEISVVGESMNLPVLYGRNKIAGARVYHNTSPTYIATPNSPNKFFGGIMKDMAQWGGKITGVAHEFLYVQQALCQGNINEVLDVTIDGMEKDKPEYDTYGFSIYSSTEGGFADPMMTTNFPERASAVFTQVPYLSMAFWLNRDDPQFNGVPEVVAYLEGARVRSLSYVNGQLQVSATKTYSTNPALCLLDYLISKEYGRGLELEDIDLTTFYRGMLICDKIVQRNVACNGRIWKARGKTVRDLPLYECNILLDTSKAVRDNIISILSTMGDADLVWSAGKYKLQIQYPSGLGDILLAGTITDDDIVRDTVSINYPSASDRMNICTIKFADEANDFADNTAEWPPRGSAVHSIFLQEDNNIPLEKSSSEEGIVDYYHALAKAEELCRVSRSSVTYKFTVMLTGIFYEPGDIILVNSEVATIINEYLQVREIAITEQNTAEITAVKFDPAQLAWNAKDDEAVPVRNNYDFSLGGVARDSIYFEPHPENSLSESLGFLRWNLPLTTIPQSYVITARRLGDLDYISIGTSPTNYIEIFSLKAGTYEFSVRPVYPNGRQVAATISNPIVIDSVPSPTHVKFTPNKSVQADKSGTVTWDLVKDFRVVDYRIYVYKIGDYDEDYNPIFTQVGTSSTGTYELSNLETLEVIIGVTAVTRQGAESDMGLSGTIVIVYPKPPRPTGVSVALYGDRREAVEIHWTKPANRDDGSRYSDHSVTQIYRRRVGSGSAWLNAGETSLDMFVDNTSEFGELEYVLKFMSTRAILSEPSDPPQVVKVSMADALDLTPPPTITDFEATAALSNIILEWNIPSYTVGHGHGATLIYATEWKDDSEPQPSFQDTALVARVDKASMYRFPTHLGARYVFWGKTMSKDGGISTAFAGPLIAKTGLIGNADLGEDIIEAGNIADNSISNQKLFPGLEAVVFIKGTVVPTENKGSLISVANVLYRWDEPTSAYVKAIAMPDVSGVLSAQQIADEILTVAKFAKGIEPVSIVETATIPTTKTTATLLWKGKLYKWDDTAKAYVATVLAPNSVSATEIQADSITAGQIAAGAISTDELAARAITAAKIAVGTITATEIRAGTITATEIAALAITAAKIATGAITADKLSANSVTAASLAAGAVTAGKLAAGSIVVGTAAIQNGAIVNAMIGLAAVDSAKIADASIVNAKIANAAITSAKIGDAQVDTLRIAGNAVTVPTFTTASWEARSTSWMTTIDVYVNMDFPGWLFASSTGYIAYGSGFGDTSSRLLIDGAEVSGGGGTEGWVNAAHSGARYVAAGTHYIQLQYQSPSNLGRMLGRSLFAMAVKR